MRKNYGFLVLFLRSTMVDPAVWDIIVHEKKSFHYNGEYKEQGRLVGGLLFNFFSSE